MKLCTTKLKIGVVEIKTKCKLKIIIYCLPSRSKLRQFLLDLKGAPLSENLSLTPTVNAYAPTRNLFCSCAYVSAFLEN